MADDGMLLNLAPGHGPVSLTVRFTGGRWRDRVRAKREARLQILEPSQAKPPANVQQQPETADDPEPSAKRRKHLATGFAPPTAYSQVTSRLFSANPAPKTATVRAEDTHDQPAPLPSNAPLAAGAASFSSLGLGSRLVGVLAQMGLERPTAIQEAVVPVLLSAEDSDAFVQAETGSGKTLAYLLPILNRVLAISQPERQEGQPQQPTQVQDGSRDADASAAIHRDSGIFAIVVAPTRELARQTHEVLSRLLRPFPWLVATAMTGGESKKAEKARLRRGVNFVVATPGRLVDHLDNTRALSFRTVRWLILDEGDRLMELGFEQDIRKLVTSLSRVPPADRTSDGTALEPLPARRVTVLCSATMRMSVQRLGEMSLADAIFVESGPGRKAVPGTENGGDGTNGDGAAGQVGQAGGTARAPAQLQQSYIVVPAKLRLVTLISHLRASLAAASAATKSAGPQTKMIVFCSCADSVNFHFSLLKKGPLAQNEAVTETGAEAGYLSATASPTVELYRLHGSLAQAVRTATLRAFAGAVRPAVLFATDVASRGLDIASVDTVVEYDPAFCFADHIHRVGRTARAGRSGKATVFLLPGSEEGYISLLDSSSSSLSATSRAFHSVLRSGLASFPLESLAAADGQGRPSAPSSRRRPSARQRTAQGDEENEEGDKAPHARVAEALQLHLEQRLLVDARTLDSARTAFRSHVRAYATHVKEERGYFDLGMLHLGHVAKSFGLREAPGGIGAGIDKRARGKAAARERDDVGVAAREMHARKSRAMMAGASEFNIA